MTPRRLLLRILVLATFASIPASAQFNYTVVLKKAWVKKYADRATIDATMTVLRTHKSPNKISDDGKDGDLHFAGTSTDIGLPFVAEVVNATMAGQKDAVDLIKASQASGDPLQISGAWRLWFEHPSNKQTQGGNNAFHPDNTNPDHSFEIHPVNKVDTEDIGASFVMVPGYTAYTAATAFTFFDACRVQIKASQSGITIRSKKLKYNYVEFDIELTHAPKAVSDGFIASARITVDDGDETVVEGERRMIFVAGTKAAEAIADASAGDRFTVLGIPRINLKRVLTLVAQHGTSQFETGLPYEMIIVGVRAP